MTTEYCKSANILSIITKK